jgi:hypothetical protein
VADRLIREGLKTSARVGALSERAELLFVRLLLTACPLGRYHAEPGLVKSGTLPNRPRIRLTDVALALDEIERAGLIARWTEPDGATFLQVPRFGQQLRYAARSPYPAPPKGTPDVDGQDVMAFAMDREPPGRPPLPLVRERPEPVERAHSSEQKEEKRREEKARVARDTRSALDCVDELRKRWPRHEMLECIKAAEKHMRARLAKEGREPSPVTVWWLEEHWMPNEAEAQKKTTDHGPLTMEIPEEPDGWREWVRAHERSHPKFQAALNYRWGEMLPAQVWATIARVVNERRMVGNGRGET